MALTTQGKVFRILFFAVLGFSAGIAFTYWQLVEPCPPCEKTVIQQDIKAKKGVVIDAEQDVRQAPDTTQRKKRKRKKKRNG